MLSEFEGDVEDWRVFAGFPHQEWVHSELVDTFLDRVIDFAEYPFQVFTEDEQESSRMLLEEFRTISLVEGDFPFQKILVSFRNQLRHCVSPFVRSRQMTITNLSRYGLERQVLD